MLVVGIHGNDNIHGQLGKMAMFLKGNSPDLKADLSDCAKHQYKLFGISCWVAGTWYYICDIET